MGVGPGWDEAWDVGCPVEGCSLFPFLVFAAEGGDGVETLFFGGVGELGAIFCWDEFFEEEEGASCSGVGGVGGVWVGAGWGGRGAAA